MSKKSETHWQRLKRALLHHLWRIGIGLWVSRLGRRNVPLDVDNSEVLIRAVTNFGLDRGKPKAGLFLSDEGISVSRRRWIEPWLAKLYAKAHIQKPPKHYRGLAFVSAELVRSQEGWDVQDSRSEYIGHADVVNGVHRAVPGEALPPLVAKTIRAQAKVIAKAAKYVEDPRPRRISWLGGE
jgi:hypothetical protein